ncbi:MAG: DUF5615 family PIN-like protein [Verrucomicrobia bacterium]|nr:DUF5615 family PIN-like protein [Verrucomicrobiota bacterium]MDA1087708.1 DUF5615 family PIN-like protein [Verrucomicrobiota bacterium]
MKLLFDQNLSPSLVERLVDPFPASSHVHAVGLDQAADKTLWDFARDNEFTIVTKDVDFSDRSALLGHPPKVIWIRLGNCTTSDIERALRERRQRVATFAEDKTAGVLAVFN